MQIVIIINFLLYLLQTIHCYRKYPSTIYYYLWLYFCVFAGASVFIVTTGIYELRFENLSHNTKFSITPYLLFFLCIHLLLYPLKNINKKIFVLSPLILRKLAPIVKYLCIILSLYILFKLFEYSMFSHYSVMERREMSVEGEGFLNRGTQPLLWYLDFILWMIHDIATPFLILYTIYAYIQNCISNKKILWILCCIIIPQFITYIIASNRSGLFFLIINFSFFILLFRKYIPPRFFRRIIKYGLFISIPFVIILAIISIARYESSDISTQNGILSYFGESFPNLHAFVYEQNYRISYGARLFPKYFELLTGITFNLDGGIFYYHQFWTEYTGVYIHVFKTLFGDLYLEFGSVGTILFIGLISIITNYILTKSNNLYFIISIAYIYICFCTNSVLDFGLIYGGFYLPRYILGCFLLSVFLKKHSY